MKSVLLMLAFGFVLASTQACAEQAAPPQPPDRSKLLAVDKDLVVVGDAADGVEVDAKKEREVKVRIKNTSSRRIIVTHVGFNSAGALLAITPLDLSPGEGKPLELLVDGGRLLLPSTANLFLRVRDGGTQRTILLPVQFTSKDVFVLHPRTLGWGVGDEPKAKASKVINLPVGKTITGVKVSDPAFTVKLEGSVLLVTPMNTAEPRTATVTLITEPASEKPPLLFVNVVAKSPAARGPLPVAPSAENNKTRPL